MHRLLWGVLGLSIAVVLGAVVMPFGQLRRTGGSAALPVYGQVPEFTLTERSGRSVTAGDLRGRVWVANFIFTQCPGVCPALSARMAALQQALRARRESGAPGNDVRLVSISVDPTRDTPEVLRRYAARFRADPDDWLFLTGSRGAVQRPTF